MLPIITTFSLICDANWMSALQKRYASDKRAGRVPKRSERLNPVTFARLTTKSHPSSHWPENSRVVDLETSFQPLGHVHLLPHPCDLIGVSPLSRCNSCRQEQRKNMVVGTVMIAKTSDQPFLSASHGEISRRIRITKHSQRCPQKL